MARVTSMPVFLKKGAQYMNVIKAIEDFKYWTGITGQSYEEWQIWRIQTAQKWQLDISILEEGGEDMVCAKYEAMISIMCNSCMTPGEIAQKAGVSKNAVYRVRKGYMVRMEIMGKVCAALGVRCEDVLDYERMERYREEQRQNGNDSTSF